MVVEDKPNAIDELVKYCDKNRKSLGITSDFDAIKKEIFDYLSFAADLPPTYSKISQMKPLKFWKVFGRGIFPILSKVRERIFSVPTSSAASERVWSVFDLVHRVEKLVFLYANSAILSQTKNEANLFALAVNGDDSYDSN